MECQVCGTRLEASRQGNGILCEKCDHDRLVAASGARIMAGTGLTYSNSEKFSQENWVRMMKATGA